MDLNFLTIALLNIYLTLFLYLFNLLVTASLLNQKPNRRKAFLWVFPYMLLIVPLPSLFFLMDMFHSLFISLTEIYLETGAWALAVKGIYRIPWKHTFATAGLSNFLSRAVSSLNGIFLSRNYDLTVPKDLAAYLFTESIGILLPALFILWIIRRNELFREYQSILSENGKSKYWWLLFPAAPGLDLIATELTNERAYLNNSNPMVSVLFVLLLYGVVNYTFRCDVQRKRIEAQNMNIQQQKLYIQNLENVQKEVRLFRHDFRNMMAGASLQAESGDLKSLQEFISRMTGDFERQVGKQIFQITQIGNIQITELKGLLILKTTEMQRKNISFHLEIPAPFHNPGISSGDLCRAVGILLDNAAEAAEKTKDREVTAIFHETEETIRIIIRNSFEGSIPLARIWEDGYSTKGEGRGNGLTSFRRILDRYDNAVSYTRQENGLFIQELLISKTGGKRHDSYLSVRR